jgi:hypothetical protein
MRTPAIAVIACLPLWLVGSASGDTDHELSIGGGARALRTTSANALTDANLDGLSFSYARALGFAPRPGISVWAELGAATGAADGTMFQALSTQLATVELTGGLRVRYQLLRQIALSARAALGAQRARVDISDHDGGSAADHGWGSLASVGAALDLFALARPPFGIGLRIDAGYTVTRSIALAPHRRTSGDALMLATTDLTLGKLDLSGPTLAISLIAQF